MEAYKHKKIILFVITIMMMFNTACGHSAHKTAFKNEEIRIEDFNTLKNTLMSYKNPDNGFGFLADEYYSQKDLYTTYYAIETLKLTGYFEEGDFPQIDATLLGNLDQISISDVYFFTSLFAHNIFLDKSLCQKIEKFVLSLTTNEGIIAVNKSEKKSMNKMDAQKMYTSTYMGLKVLDTIKSIHFRDLAYKWITNSLDKIANSETYNKEQIGDLNMVITISDISDYNYSKYKNQILKQLNMFEKDLEKRLNNNIEIPLYDIDIYESLLKSLGLEPNTISKELCIYVEKYQNPNGGFGLYLKDQTNILPTFMAVNILKNNNIPIPDESKIFSLIKRYKLADGYYIPIAPIGSSLQDTYYSYSILKMLDAIDINKDIKSYIDKINFSILGENEILYYYSLKDTISEEDHKVILKNVQFTIKNMLSSQKKGDIYKQIRSRITLLEYIRLMKDPSPVKNDKLIKYFNTYSNTHDNLGFISDCANMKILSSFGIRNTDFEKDRLEKAKQALDYVYQKEKYENLLLLYVIIDSIDESDIDNLDQNSKNIAYDILERCYLGEGVFKSGVQSDQINYCNTYYGLKIMKKLKMF